MKNLVIISFLLLSACTNEAENHADIEAFSPKDDQTERVAVHYSRKDFTKSEDVINEWRKLTKKFKAVPFVTRTEIGNIYLFSNTRDFELPSDQLGYVKPFDKIGLADAQGKVLLPCVYDKIGNPGGIAYEYMELCQDKKYGLYNYKTKTVIKPEFDFIFPSKVMGYVAIGKKGAHFYKIYEDGEILMIIDDGIPSYQTLGERSNFDIHDPATAMWISTYFMKDYPASKEYMDEMNSAMIFPPSYIVNLDVVFDVIEGIELESSYGIEQMISKAETVKPRTKETDSYLRYFHEIGSSGRSYEVERRQLVTIDKQSRVLDSKYISTKYFRGIECDNARYHAVNFLNDSLIQVRENDFGYDSKPYYSRSVYVYYEISASGKITQLHPGNLFPMASVVKLTENHFKGCFAKSIEDADYNIDSGEQEANTILTSHLSISDLEYMINEIYARHGLIFKDARWKQVFSAQHWYKGKSANVDSKLTPVEKANIRFIKAFISKMKDNETTYTKPQETFFMEP